MCWLKVRKMSRWRSQDVYRLTHGSLYMFRKETQVTQEACFSHGATRGHPSLVLLNNLITQLFKARRGPNIVDIPEEPYPTDTRKYLIILRLWPEIYPPLQLNGVSSKPICLWFPRKTGHVRPEKTVFLLSQSSDLISNWTPVPWSSLN